MDRTEPNRNWSGVFGTPNGSGEHTDAGRDGAGPQSGSPLSDVVARSVEVGYKVVDEYLRQGQNAARRMGEGSYGPQAWAGDVQELGVRMTQHASDLIAAWMQLVEMGLDGADTRRAGAPFTQSTRPAPPRTGAFDPATTVAPDAGPASGLDPATAPVAAPTPTTSGALAVRIVADRRVEVYVEMRAAIPAGRMVVHALRSADASRPKIDTLELSDGPRGDSPTLHIEVPSEHPGGAYEALIVDDATNRPVGVVHVTF